MITPTTAFSAPRELLRFLPARFLLADGRIAHAARPAAHDVQDIELRRGEGRSSREEALPELTLAKGCSNAFTLRVTVDYEVYNHVTMIDSGTVTLTEHPISCGQPKSLDRRFEIKRDAMNRGEVYILVEAKSACAAAQ